MRKVGCNTSEKCRGRKWGRATSSEDSWPGMVQSLTVNIVLGGIGSEEEARSLVIAIKSPGEWPRSATDKLPLIGLGPWSRRSWLVARTASPSNHSLSPWHESGDPRRKTVKSPLLMMQHSIRSATKLSVLSTAQSHFARAIASAWAVLHSV